MYGAEPGKASFANNCLLARRLAERGVRFVQLYHRDWDHHSNLPKELKRQCDADRPARRRPDQGPQAARAARRDARHLGRRVRPDRLQPGGDHQGQLRPRPSPPLLHHLDGRRRHQEGHDATARPTTSATTWSKTPSTSTTSRPRSSTAWASTTPADLPLPGPRLPPDRRRRQGRREVARVNFFLPSPPGEGGRRPGEGPPCQHPLTTLQLARSPTDFARHLRRELTVPERHLWYALRDRRLQGWKFRRQVPVGPSSSTSAAMPLDWWSKSMGPATMIAARPTRSREKALDRARISSAPREQ